MARAIRPTYKYYSSAAHNRLESVARYAAFHYGANGHFGFQCIIGFYNSSSFILKESSLNCCCLWDCLALPARVTLYIYVSARLLSSALTVALTVAFSINQYGLARRSVRHRIVL